MPRLPTRISITGLAIVWFLSAASSAAAPAELSGGVAISEVQRRNRH